MSVIRVRGLWTIVSAILLTCCAVGLLGSPAAAIATRDASAVCIYDPVTTSAFPTCAPSWADGGGRFARVGTDEGAASSLSLRGEGPWRSPHSRNATEAGGSRVRSSGPPIGGAASVSLDDAAAIASRNGIDMRMIKLEFEAGAPPGMYGYTSFDGAGNLVRAADGRIVVTLTDAGLSDPGQALNTIAHELNHIREAMRTGAIPAGEGPAIAAGNAAQGYGR